MAYRIRYGPGRRPRRNGIWKLQIAAATGLLAGGLILGALFPAAGDRLHGDDTGPVAVMARVLADGGSLREAVVSGCREVLFEGQD